MKATLALILLPALCIAAEPALSPQFDACMKASRDTTYAMLKCINEETHRQDGLLNSNYKSVMQTLNARRKSQLQQAQRQWIKFRDANCAFYADPEGGTMADLAAANCMLNATASRAQELQDLNR
jgi:uncharacterized protein YecT (DUF1311 family)